MLDHVRAAAAVPSVAGFTNDVLAHLEPGGVVLSTPDYFLCARPVPLWAGVDALNPWMRWPESECDCWFIWMLSGDVIAAMDALLALRGAKEWVAFQRKGQVKVTKLKPKLAWLKAAKAGATPKQ